MKAKRFLCLMLVLAMVLPWLPANAIAIPAEPKKLEYKFTTGAVGYDDTTGDGVVPTDYTTLEARTDSEPWAYYGNNRLAAQKLFENGMRIGIQQVRLPCTSNNGIVMKIQVPEGSAGIYVPTITYGVNDAGTIMKVSMLRATAAVEAKLATHATPAAAVIAQVNNGKFYEIENISEPYVTLAEGIDTYDSSVASADAHKFTKTASTDGSAVTLEAGEYYIVIQANGKNENAIPYYTDSSNSNKNCYYFCPVSISFAEVSYSMAVSATETDLYVGETATVSGGVSDNYGQPVSATVSYESSDAAVATVDAATGVVTAVAAGTATITAKATVNGLEVSSDITLNVYPALVGDQLTYRFTTGAVGYDDTTGDGVVPTDYTTLEARTDSEPWAYYGNNRLAAQKLFENGMRIGIQQVRLPCTSNNGIVMKIQVPEGSAGIYVPTITYGVNDAGTIMKVSMLRATAAVEAKLATHATPAAAVIAQVNNGKFYEIENISEPYVTLAEGIDTYDSSVASADAHKFTKTASADGSAVTLEAGEYYIVIQANGKNENAIPYYTDSSNSNKNCYYFCPVSISFTEVTPAIALTATADQVEKGSTVQLTATVTDKLGAVTEAPVTYTSSDESIATVDANGLVTGIAQGTVTITAKALVEGNLVRKTITIEVLHTDSVTALTLLSPVIQLTKPGKTAQLSAVAEWSISGEQVMSPLGMNFVSSDEAVATVNENGLVTAVAEGTVTITATVKDTEISDSVQIQVLGAPVYNSEFYEYIFTCDALGMDTRYNLGFYSLKYDTSGWIKKDMIVKGQPWATETVDPNFTSAPMLPPSQYFQFMARFTADETTEPKLNNHVITVSLQVDEAGTYIPTVTVTTHKNGQIAKYYMIKKTGTEDLTTDEKVDAWVRSVGEAYYIGQIDTYGTANVTKDVAMAPVTLEAGDYMFLIKFDGANPASTPANSGGPLVKYWMNTISLDSSAVQSIELSADRRTIRAGVSTAQLTATGLLGSGESHELFGVTYESADPEIATVSADGVVTGIAPGKVTIKVKYETYDGWLTDEITITVRGDMAPSGVQYHYLFNCGSADSAEDVNLLTNVGTVMDTDSAPWSFQGSLDTEEATLTSDRLVWEGNAIALSFTVGEEGMYIPTATVAVGPDLGKVEYYLRPVWGNEDLAEDAQGYFNSFLAAERIAAVDCAADTAGTKTIQFPRQQLEAGEYMLVIKSTGDSSRHEILDLYLDGTAPKTLEIQVEPGTILPGETAVVSATMTHESGKTYMAEALTLESLNGGTVSIDSYGTVIGLAAGTATIQATYVSPTLTLTATATVVVDGDPMYHYIFRPQSMGETDRIISTYLWDRVADQNGSSPWYFYGVRYGNNYQLKTDESLYYNARGNQNDPGVPNKGTGYVLLLEVGKDGNFIPTLTVGMDKDRQIANYYLVALTDDNKEILKGTTAALETYTDTLTAADLLCQIDCYSPTATTKTVTLPARELEAGQYLLIVELVGKNDAVVPMESGGRTYVVNDMRSFKLDGTKLEGIVVTADTKQVDILGNTAQLSVKALYESGNSYDVANATYESLNPEFATVDENGVVTGVAVGTATIKVTVPGMGEATIKITVREDVKTSQKDGRTYYTDSIVEAARENIENYEWAKQARDEAVANAELYVNRIDEIYDLIHSNGIPRSNAIVLKNQTGQWVCPHCGKDIYSTFGFYPWVVDALNNPWKIACPDCDSQFPSNDFGSFYELGLNEAGEFDRLRALEAHRQMLIDMGLGDQLSDVKPADYTDENYVTALTEEWYAYYGYGVEGGYLYNELYPNIETDTKADGTAVLKDYETAARWGVDDGWGYGTGKTDSGSNKEERYTYIAYFSHWGIWSQNAGGGKAVISHALTNLASAYLYTGEAKYGQAGAIIIDRIADFYPNYKSSDWSGVYHNSNGGTSCGHILGQIWEAFLVQTFAKAYDAFWPAYDDPEVIAYITEKAKEQGNTGKLTEVDGVLTATAETLRCNVEDNLLRGIRNVIQEGRAVGNFGTAQTAMAVTAVVLDSHPETDEMLAWIFQDGKVTYNTSWTGGFVDSKIIQDVSRDGFGTESAGGYNIIWVEQLAAMAEVFSRYDEYEGMNLTEHPKYIAMLQHWKGLTLVRQGMAGIGDGGMTAGYSALPDEIMDLFTIFKQLSKSDDPVQQELAIEFAQHIYWASGNNVDNIPYGIFSEDPVATGEEIERIIAEHGQWDFDQNTLLSGYGFAALRSGTLNEGDTGNGLVDTQRDVWMYFGGALSHSNSDNLHIGIDAFGFSITSDHGYPEATGHDANRYQWLQSTIAHNTVTVDDSVSIKGPDPQKPLYFGDENTRVNVMDVDGSESYAQTEEYRRTIVMIDYDEENSYSIDFFKILGGDEHLYSFHVDSSIDAIYSDNLSFIQQEGGSYASPDWEQGQDPWTKGASSYETMYPRGYTWLGDVKRNDNPGTGEFWVEYEVPDVRNNSNNSDLDVHFRLTAVNDWNADEVTLTEGWPPRKPGTIDVLPHLEYVLIRRSGDQLNTLFTTVLEPYNGERFIKSITAVEIEAVAGARPASTDLAKAVKVELVDGRIDYVMYAQNSNVIYKVTDETNGYTIEFNGTVGVWTVKENSDGEYENVYSYVCNGSIIGEGSSKLQGLEAGLTGKVIDFAGYNDHENALTLDSYIDVEFDNVTVPAEAEFDAFAESLIGRIFVGEHEGTGNVVYVIQKVERLGDTSVRLKIGNVSLINGYTTAEDGSRIYTFDVAVGQAFVIPMSYSGCTHNYTHDCDATCNSCDYTRTPADHTGGTATCTEKAKCEVCGKEYGEATGHILTYVPEVPATDTANGTKAHWVCVCGKLYTDAEGKNETTAEQLVLPYNPRSGDSVLAVLVAMLMSAMAIVPLSTKTKKKSR